MFKQDKITGFRVVSYQIHFIHLLIIYPQLIKIYVLIHTQVQVYGQGNKRRQNVKNDVTESRYSTFVGLGFLCIPNQDQTMNGTHAHQVVSKIHNEMQLRRNQALHALKQAKSYVFISKNHLHTMFTKTPNNYYNHD